jgi:hypothetical protein
VTSWLRRGSTSADRGVRPGCDEVHDQAAGGEAE